MASSPNQAACTALLYARAEHTVPQPRLPWAYRPFAGSGPPPRTSGERRLELSLDQRLADEGGQPLGDRPPVEVGGHLARPDGEEPLGGEVVRQDTVEDAL